MQHHIQLKRVYQDMHPEDGLRILVDRLWPRGYRREDLKVDHWWRDPAPSPALRRDYHSERISWAQFSRAYRDELHLNPERLLPLRQALEAGPITLLTAARDVEHSHLKVLAEVLSRPEADPLEAVMPQTVTSPSSPTR